MRLCLTLLTNKKKVLTTGPYYTKNWQNAFFANKLDVIGNKLNLSYPFLSTWLSLTPCKCGYSPQQRVKSCIALWEFTIMNLLYFSSNSFKGSTIDYSILTLNLLYKKCVLKVKSCNKTLSMYKILTSMTYNFMVARKTSNPLLYRNKNKISICLLTE